MTTAQALTGLVSLIPLAVFSGLAFWRFHPVLFMFCAGIAMITGFYMADIINGGTTSELSLTVSLALIGYSMVCIAFAYSFMFREVEE